jgi:c(7)-type cytochrome triheme protein
VKRALGRVLALSLVCASALALGAAFPARVRIPPRDPAAPRSVPAVWFSHRGHQSFGCYACHPSTFAQEPIGFTHQEMRQRRFCGQCHDGDTAFAIESAPCVRCHVR